MWPIVNMPEEDRATDIRSVCKKEIALVLPETDRHTHRQTDTLTDRQTHPQTDRHTHRQTDRHTHRQTDTLITILCNRSRGRSNK